MMRMLICCPINFLSYIHFLKFFSFYCSVGWVYCSVFQITDAFVCVIYFAIESLYCIFQFSYSIPQLCDFCLLLVFLTHFWSLVCLFILLLSSLSIFMANILNSVSDKSHLCFIKCFGGERWILFFHLEYIPLFSYFAWLFSFLCVLCETAMSLSLDEWPHVDDETYC